MKRSLEFWTYIKFHRPDEINWDLMYTLNTDWDTCVLNLYPSQRHPLVPPADLLLRQLVEDLSLTYFSQNVWAFYAGFDAIEQLEELTRDIEI